MVKETMDDDGCPSNEVVYVSGAENVTENVNRSSSEVEINHDVAEDPSESASLLNEALSGDDGISQNSNEDGESCDYEDHPLRALSCASIPGVESTCESQLSTPSGANVPVVYISVPITHETFQSETVSSRNERNDNFNHGSNGCIPLNAIFHPEIGQYGAAANSRGDQSAFDYKNWLMHLGRRRRCEILILVGFLMWLAFFIVLAIVLNGQGNKTSDEDDLSWKGSVAITGKQNRTYGILEEETTSITSNITNDLLDTDINTSSSTVVTVNSRNFATKLELDKSEESKANYLIGVGRADMTGPTADVNFMGYAQSNQRAGGIHMRQYARAFIVEDRNTKVRTAFVNIDACMSSTLVKLEVLKSLKFLYGETYTTENLCISGTHTHSAPAGFLQDVLFQVSSWGYVDETLVAMVNGIVESIQRAHDAVQPGYILMNKGQLIGSNINRSPLAYLNNPPDERAKYLHNVDTEMTLLKFMNEKEEGIGMINWFPVHCTSMNNTNSLVSSDNKGYAELLFEQHMDPDSLVGRGKFVAAFAQSNEGDVSPNTNGPHCMDTGKSCDNIHSTCNGQVQMCIASGPGKDMFESTKIIGNNQFKKAKDLYENAESVVEGPVKFIHQYVNMTNYEVVVNDTIKVKTCKPAMGFSFAAGTTDGPGAFDFKQGDTSGNTFWHVVRNFLHPPTPQQGNCHAPKPILLDTGEMASPYEWQPEIVDTQIFQIGQVLILALPGEFTTMAGRRLRDGVLETLKAHDPKIQYEPVIAGLANAYSDYITTFEEYQVQRYEGASTIYGPYTAKAYTQQYQKLSKMLVDNLRAVSSCKPVDNKKNLYEFQTGVYLDLAPFFSNFGDVIADVKKSYMLGDEVSVSFVAGNPRSSLKAKPKPENNTFLIVQMEQSDGSWNTVHTDADWETKFIWLRTSTFRATSEVTIKWATDQTTPPGRYRIAHHGYYKSPLYGVLQYSGQSSTFTIRES